VGACSYILSCLVLNGAASRGPGSSVAYLVLKGSLSMIAGARVHAELGREDKVDWADRF
jgi:hypothetical protein